MAYAWYIEDMHTTYAYRKLSGFTLVELAVTMMIIGVLISVSVFAWGSWQRTTAANVLKNDLSQAAAQLKSDLNWKNTYPETQDEADNNKGLPKSKGTDYAYTRLAANEYCLTAYSDRSGVPAYHISSTDTTPREGVCSGHIDPSVPLPTTMLAFSAGHCSMLDTYTGSNDDAIITLTDDRDGVTRSYRVAKLADGKCWMLDNLRLGSTSGTIGLTPANTNIANNFTLPRVMTSGSSSSSTPYAFGSVPGDTGANATNYGYLYNWPAATAGQTTSTMPDNSGNTPSDICVTGWRLPTGGSAGEYAGLHSAMGSTHGSWQYGSRFKAVFAGNWTGGSFGSQGSVGLLWTATAYTSSGNAYSARIVSNGVQPENNSSRSAGLAVRCILN